MKRFFQKKSYRFCTLLLIFISASSFGQTNNYFGTSGTLTGNVWSTNPAGPYNNALTTTGGPILNFNNAGSATGASIASTVGINFGAAITWSAGGTIGAAGINLPINVSSGIEQDMSGQAFSAAATAAFTKNGLGALALAGGAFGGGFTLNSGTIIARGVNAMGGNATPGLLTINGGTISANATRTFAGKYSNIIIGGNFTLGATTGLSLSSANLTFSNTMNLGGASRTITIGGTGIYALNGVISNGSLEINSTAAGIISLGGANTYSGGTSISGGTLQLGAAGVLADSGPVILNGGNLRTGSTTGFSETAGTLSLTANSTITLGTGAHSLTFAASDGVSWTGGAMLTINGWTGGYDGTSGTAGKIFVGASAAGLTAAQLSQIQFFNGTSNFPASILPSGEVVPGITILPTINVSPITLTSLNYVFGNGPSAEQTFTCSGTNLSTNITITAPANYEISTTSGAGFGTSVTLIQSSGSVASTTIYVRLIAGLAAGNYNGEVINITSTGAAAKTVTCSGTVSIIVSGVFINEVLVNPSDGNDGSNAPNTSEWIELYNSTGATVDIGCWVITDGDFAVTIPSGTTLASGGYFTIASAAGSGLTPNLDWALCSCTSGASSQVGILTNSAEQVLMYDAAGTLVDAVIWGGGQLPGSMSSIAVGSCGAQNLNFPAAGSFENIGTISDGVANERDTDGSTTWGQAGTGSFGATNGSPLPIELLSFSGKISGEDVLLSWTTASETNNDFFTIEKSTDGTEYVNIAEINGAGNSSSVLNYSSYDYEPLAGINYYRLKQTDFDGRSSYSQIISVSFNSGLITKIFPNPASDFLNIDISGKVQEKLQLQIITCLGVVVKQEIPSKKDDLQYTLNVMDLSPGTYILRTITDSETRQALFIKK
ncbi:MAG: hypothetical protein K0S44_2565 [Bacteroidetes bacterium]|jgi:autotransporter-associated beta strand protein|nr:hypothetical protein [Bacteroidota bacterium]